ncbi:MAG TPA: erythromycin esterase family protein [Planctomycetota bacterium]|nr:erythromycin esterase family protein [Planctomycetota bacterium]
MPRSRAFAVEAPGAERLVDSVRAAQLPLTGPADLEPLLERLAAARFVLLGEASHGTSEFYTLRTRLTRRLVEEHGFDLVAVEGDWPDCQRVNAWIQGGAGGSAREVLAAFGRWPRWMWANEEVARLAGWLREHNAGRPPGQRVGFHGLDVYSLWESLQAIFGYLRHANPEALPAALRALLCFEPYGEDVQEYARATRLVPETCEQEVVALLAELRRRPAPPGADGWFEAEQNALVLQHAEAYYRAMVRGGPESWNIRDRHMHETLERLVSRLRPGGKAIVWEHNTHVGDARYTDMVADGLLNVGQLTRLAHPGQTQLVGLGTHRGTVIAAQAWDAPAEVMHVPDARDGSWEDVLHRALRGDDGWFLFDGASRELLEPRGHRAIGVVYHPEREAFGNYVPTVLPRRYDAFVFLDATSALHPIGGPGTDEHEVPETFPWGE